MASTDRSNDPDIESDGSAPKDNTGLLEVPVSKPNKENAPKTENGFKQNSSRLRRFPLRALVLIIIPPAILTYFVVLKTVLLTEDPEMVPYGHRNGRWVYYSWFFIGVFGLGASRYGLEAAEAAMLQDPFWAPKDGRVLFSHAEKTWNGLAGWWYFLKATVKSRGRKRLAGRLWFLHAVLSLAVYIALPLSGLAMELYDGYVKASGQARVIGRTTDNFYEKYGNKGVRASQAWLSGAPMTPPGAGVVHTPPDFDRKETESLQSLPNSLPHTGGIVDLFLAPQSVTLVRGRAWGLRLGYKCDVVTDASNFTLLSRRWSTPDSVAGINDNTIGDVFNFDAKYNDTTITFWNTGNITGSPNVKAYGEIAHNRVIPRFVGNDLIPDSWEAVSTFDEEGLKSANNVIEIALWQLRGEVQYKETLGDIGFNETVKPSLAGLGSPFVFGPEPARNFSLNNTFLPEQIIKENNNLSAVIDIWGPLEAPISIAEPIGVRCLHQYQLGFADLHPELATFTSFTPAGAVPRGFMEDASFGPMALNIIHRNYYDIFSPTARRSESNYWFYIKFIDSESMRKAVMRAYAMNALDAMFDLANDFDHAYEHPNLTATKEGKVLGPGDIPAEIPLALFAVWAAGCVIIGIMYGFKARWAETLNGFGMFVLGSDFAKEVRDGDLAIHEDFADSESLGRIPGMVGEAETTDSDVAHLTLVDRRKGKRVSWKKLYN
ncbi:hypothetical protein AJ79_00441 [Helicocarpus griseus UAMH5409]|uniref:Uncharacterized protein n=1 Tax=Helicocarpus griseus UAMH5409 TaxID=1447875 RepID=A0A2B7Y2R9_9EURO|nr:hypothetical protein AJ79_00441 [Helicocarpus griseus UAMH5409]